MEVVNQVRRSVREDSCHEAQRHHARYCRGGRTLHRHRRRSSPSRCSTVLSPGGVGVTREERGERESTQKTLVYGSTLGLCDASVLVITTRNSFPVELQATSMSDAG